MNNLEIVKFEINGLTLNVSVSLSEKTALLSKEDMSALFDRDRSAISRHIKAIFSNNELEEKSNVHFLHIPNSDKPVPFYSLDVVTLVGYRVKSHNGILLKEFVDKYIDAYYSKEDNSIIIYNNGDISLPVTISPNEETVWVEKDPLTNLFGTTRQNVEYHIENIYNQGELEKESTCKEILQVQLEGDRNVTRLVSTYNLDLIISLGYRINTKKGIMFRKWATKILKEYLIKGYAIDSKRAVVSVDNFIRLENEVEDIKKDLGAIKKQIDEGEIKAKLFFKGEYFDARSFIDGLIAKAKRRIVLIDPYSDVGTLDYLKNKMNEVQIYLCDSSNSKLSLSDIESFNKQYGDLMVIKNDTFHDRFLIIDDVDLYHLGTSLNYVGNKTFAITKMEDKIFIELIYQKLGI